MAVFTDRTSPNNTTGKLGSQGDHDLSLSLFPLESNEPLARVIHPSATKSPLVNNDPIVFTRVRIDASMIVDIEDPRPPLRSAEHIARVQKRMRRVVRPYAMGFRSRPLETTDKVRLPLLFAIVIATGGATIAMHALQSVDRARPTTSQPEPRATAAAPLAVTASVPLTPTDPIAALPQVTAARISDTDLVARSRRTALNRPARALVSGGSKRSSAVAPARFHGRLIVTSEPNGATVLINQRPVGVTPLELSRFPASSYAVWVQHEGYHRWTAGVRVPANAVTRVRAHLRKSSDMTNR
jgi:hypothetical protein